MAGPPPAVAEVRVAVRRELADLRTTSNALVLAACSGGADSLALAAALAFLAPRSGLRAGLVTVDHGLQPGSDDRARAVADWAKTQGFDPVEAPRVEVGGTGGPEAAARAARYQALDEAAARSGAAAVLLGHTRDDQAETVLLAMARGAGLRGIAGMPARRGIYRRPLLGLSRATTTAACAELGLEPWDDPHNTDPSYARARVRAVMPALEQALGPGLAGNLARTARLAAADAALLDTLAEQALDNVSGEDGALDVARLAELPDALRTRALRLWALSLGCSGSALSARHVDALDALVVAWSGQGPAHLPGGVLARRVAGRLVAR
ncbi:MAG: tRNA lysidine(34) synthetase TilS [Micromonosporaceae bacterium]|nr:tRNA lysidine(34) synthetase TilS [Micromonosporaceae bacterium]